MRVATYFLLCFTGVNEKSRETKFSIKQVLIFQKGSSVPLSRVRATSLRNIMNIGYIQLHRKLLDSAIFSSELGLKIWVWCLLKATYQERDIYVGRQKVHLEPGQFVYGRISASEQLGIAQSTVRNWINILKQDSYINIKSTNKYSIISIKNWHEYQAVDSKKDSNEANKRKTKEKQMDTNNNINKVKKDNNINTYVSEFNKLFDRDFRTTSGRKSKLEARLRVFRFEQIMEALENLSCSKFHQGENDRGWRADPDFLIRNDEQIDKWLNRKPKNKKKVKKLYLPGEERD